MKPFKLAASLAVALSLAPFAALAQDAEESPFTWSIAGVSDYVWRGVSQSDEHPTGQVGLTYSHDSGFYVGTWASGVDFDAGKPNIEVDGFVGYNTDFSESVNFDVMVNRYMYPEAGGLNFNELITKTTFIDTYALTVAYSDDYAGTDEDAWYFNAGGSWELPHEFGLTAGVGYNMTDDALGDDYVDWNIGVNRSWGLFTAALAYVGTDGSGKDIYGDWADDRVVLTLSVGN